MRGKKNRKTKNASKASRLIDADVLLCGQAAEPVSADTDKISKSNQVVQKSQISVEIIRVTKASENLCMFSCMHNSLRRDDLRRAFCGENAKEIVSKMFVELAAGQRDFQSDQLLDRVKDGYVLNDMNRYRTCII